VKRKLIQCGVGGWGATWLGKVEESETWELAALVDSVEANLEDACATTSVPAERCFSSVAEAAAAVDADAALVVVPPQAHLPVAAEALAAGLHVLVEKPLADNMENGGEMVRLAEQAGLTLMVSQNYRYDAAPQAVANVMRQGWLGEVTYATIEFRKGPHFALPDVKHGYGHYKFIEDMAVHHFDQLRGILGVEPAAVYAQARNPEWSWMEFPPVVSAVIELDNGGLLQYFGSWIARGRQTTWDGDWTVDCENGQIEWAHNEVRVRPEEIYYSVHLDGFRERNGWMEANLDGQPAEDRTFTLEEFGRCIEEGREPETSGRDNLRSVALTHAVADSARTGERVEIADYLAQAEARQQATA
jgi:predicted dehydrogenase